MQTPEEVFYVAGRVPHHAQGNFRFELERVDNGHPYITRHPAGTQAKPPDAHLYKIAEDFSRVFLVKSEQPAELDSPAEAELTLEQQRELREVIRTGRYIY